MGGEVLVTMRVDSSLQKFGCAGKTGGTAVFRRLGPQGDFYRREVSMI